jgi:arylformamidase
MRTRVASTSLAPTGPRTVPPRQRSIVAGVWGLRYHAAVGMIDLSMPLSVATTPVPGHPCPEFEPYHELERDGIRNTVMRMTLHTATHVDAPSHIVPDGLTIDAVAVDTFVGPGVRVDLRSRAKPGTPISVEDLEAGGFDPTSARGMIVVLNAGWTDAHAGTPRLYDDNPFLDANATKAVVTAAPRAIALDFAIDETKPWPNHQVALGAGIPLIENLMGLARLERSTFFLSALPLRVVGGDGAPTRAVAYTEP